MRKVGEYITTLILDITRAGYRVNFCRDLSGMVRVEFLKDHVSEFYEHVHCGFPDCSISQLEKSVIDTLIWFKNEFGVDSSRRRLD